MWLGLHHRHVDVGAEHQRLAPEAHGTVGIELLRLAERALRLFVIEAVGQPQSLIEIGLCGRARRGDLVGERAEAVPHRRIGVGEGQRRRGGIRSRLRHPGLRRGQTDHAADGDASSGRRPRVAEDEVQVALRQCRIERGIGRRGIRRAETRALGRALAVEGEQRHAAGQRSCAGGAKRHPQSRRRLHEILQAIESQRPATCRRSASRELAQRPTVSQAVTGTRRRAALRSTCARTA
jgi:hypothetical protein